MTDQSLEDQPVGLEAAAFVPVGAKALGAAGAAEVQDTIGS